MVAGYLWRPIASSVPGAGPGGLGWAGSGYGDFAARVEARELVPVMLLEQGAPKDFSFMPLRQYGEAATQEIRPSFSQLLDEFYARRDRAESLRRRGAELARTAHTARERGCCASWQPGNRSCAPRRTGSCTGSGENLSPRTFTGCTGEWRASRPRTITRTAARR